MLYNRQKVVSETLSLSRVKSGTQFKHWRSANDNDRYDTDDERLEVDA